MKTLKQTIAPVAVIALLLFQCTSTKVSTHTFQHQTPFNVQTVSFQEWYAGVKLESSGINLYIPIVNVPTNVVIDEVFFRNLKGKLVKQGNAYTAVLKHMPNTSNFTIADQPKQEVSSFNIKPNTCVISYIENGQPKYYKINTLSEVTVAYFETEPLSVYIKPNSESMAALDDLDEN